MKFKTLIFTALVSIDSYAGIISNSISLDGNPDGRDGRFSASITSGSQEGVVGRNYARIELDFERNNEFLKIEASSLFNSSSVSSMYTARRYVNASASMGYKVRAVRVNSNSNIDVASGIPVSVQWTAFGRTNAIDYAHTSAISRNRGNLRMYNGEEQIRYSFDLNGDDSVITGNTEHLLINEDFGLSVNFDSTIQLESTINFFKSGNNFALAYASTYLDPVVTIDQAWEFADEFKLEYSMEGFQPQQLVYDSEQIEVPEPNSIMLSLLSLIFLRKRVMKGMEDS